MNILGTLGEGRNLVVCNAIILRERPDIDVEGHETMSSSGSAGVETPHNFQLLYTFFYPVHTTESKYLKTQTRNRPTVATDINSRALSACLARRPFPPR